MTQATQDRSKWLCHQLMGAFHLTKTFENVVSAANGTEISPKSIQKFLKLLNFEMRTIQPQNLEFREQS